MKENLKGCLEDNLLTIREDCTRNRRKTHDFNNVLPPSLPLPPGQRKIDPGFSFLCICKSYS